jgi:hypothetical protein
VADLNSGNAPPNGAPLSNEEFELLALRYLDGMHSEEEALRLSEHLRSSAEKRDVFAALSMEIGMLGEMSLSARQGLSVGEGKGSLQGSESQFPAARAKPIVFGDLSEPGTSESGKWWSTNLPSYFLGIAVLVTAGVIGWRMLPHDVEEPPVAAAPEAPKLPTGVRTVRLLDSGTTTLELPNVGTVVVQGPADFELIGPKRARLHQGRIKVNITEENGKGFVVETPDGEVEDLGTEFGLDVSDDRSTGLVVFQGIVDLRVGESQPALPLSPPQRLIGGEAVLFSKSGQVDRLMSIATGSSGTFQLLDEAGVGEISQGSAVITQVSDNLRPADMRKFYQIVLKGLREDALTYVDRPAHQWNGVSGSGMPNYLVGADYIKMFNDDKLLKDFELSVTISRPATLYVFLDVRVSPPDWLLQDFEATDDKLGLDNGPFFAERYKRFANYKQGVGAGNSIDEVFSIWKRVVKQPGVVKLGSNAGKTWECGMYCLAAVPLNGTHPSPPVVVPTASAETKSK